MVMPFPFLSLSNVMLSTVLVFLTLEYKLCYHSIGIVLQSIL